MKKRFKLHKINRGQKLLDKNQGEEGEDTGVTEAQIAELSAEGYVHPAVSAGE